METQEEAKKVEKRMSPEYRAAKARYIPISTDPIDKYTPEWFKENMPAPKWPVIHIRKPGSLDMLELMEREAKVEEPKVDPEPEAEADKAAWKAKRDKLRSLVLSREAVRTWRDRVSKFENMTSKEDQPLEWAMDEKGAITDACLNMVPWQLLIDVHFRYDALFYLTELEKEGLESQPASA